MQCDVCRKEAVLIQPYSGRHLCGRHFVADVEAKAKRSVRAHRWLRPGDHIAVMISGDKKSGALLYFMKNLIRTRRDIRLSAIPAEDGILKSGGWHGAERLAELLEVPFIPWSSPEISGSGIEEIVRSEEPGTCNGLPDSSFGDICIQNTITTVALGFSLDDMAQGILMRFLGGNLEALIHPHDCGTRPWNVICPLHSIPSGELELYWDCQGTDIDLSSGSPVRGGFETDVAGFMEEYYHHHPATKYALLHVGEELSNGGVAVIPVTGARKADWRGNERPDRLSHGGVTNHAA